MFTVEFVPSAVMDLESLPKSAQAMIISSINRQLAHEPLVETRNRKPLRPNQLASWEMRITKYRVFYDVDPATNRVTISAVGYKEHNKLYIRGKEFVL